MNTPHNTFSLIIRLLDAFLIGLCGFAAYAWRFDFTLPSSDYFGLIIIGVLLAQLFFPLFGLYRSWRGGLLIDLAGRVTLAWGMVFMTLLLMLFAFQLGMGYSRIWVFLWGGLSAGGLIVLRFVTYGVLHQMRRRGLNQKRVALVGQGSTADDILRRIDEAHWAGYRIEAHFSVDEIETSSSLLPLDQLAPTLHQHAIDEVWISLPLRDEAGIQHILMLLRHSTVNIRYVPDIFAFRLINHGVSQVAGIPMLDISTSPMTGMNRLIKAFEDRLLALIILILISPVLSILALGVKLTSPGPVFYRQERIGWNGKPFTMLKFRSMPVDIEKNGVQWGNAQSKTNTRFGSFIRRTSLDELPQFINVLKGDMSIVGPRPERTIFVEQFKDEIPNYMKKHLVKAGITGWAQVNGWRGDTDIAKRIEYDLYYIENWSFGFDLKIIFLTLLNGFRHPNAS